MTTPLWVTVLSALLTPAIAVVVAVIACLQWRVNHNRLRLELFEKRYAMYAAARDYIGHIVANARFDEQAGFKFLLATREGEWLFDAEMKDFLDTLYKKSIQVGRTRDVPRSDPQRAGMVEQQTKLMNWFMDQPDELKRRCEPFMRITA